MKKATHQATKEHNTRLVLQMVYHENGSSRADISRATGLTRTTVSEIVGELLEAGLVLERGPGAATVGKPPTCLAFHADSRRMICIDLGGGAYRGAVMNLRGEILHRRSMTPEEPRGEGALRSLDAIIEDLLPKVDAPLLGIGVGSPGPVDPERGIVITSVNRAWANFDLRQSLQDRYGVPIHVANDSQVAALAEAAYGGHGRTPNLVLIRVDEGIGAGIVLGGKLYAGETFKAGEIGHLCIERHGPRCFCGHSGCLEALASGPSLLRLAEAALIREPGSRMARAAEEEGLSLGLLQELAEEREPVALGLVRGLGTSLGIAVAGLVGILNIRKIVLAGIPCRFGEPVLEALREEARARMLPEQGLELEAGLSNLGGDIVLKGACALVLARELGVP
jgi:N-acetylglucosamine repressor